MIEIIKPSHKILTEIDGQRILKNLEMAARVCYKSEDKATDDSAEKLIKRILGKKHDSVIEHESISVRFICDRGVSHELVRHRMASFSQESTRYVNYSKKGMQFILPPWVSELMAGIWNRESFGGKFYCEEILETPDYIWGSSLFYYVENYDFLIDEGWTTQQARTVLPNSLKTELVMTANLREWRHILKLRTAKAAHPQMRELMIPLLEEFKAAIPVIFEDITHG